MNCHNKLNEIIANLDYIPKLLLHSCCAPCSSHVISYLTNYFDITIYYYNPNIEPLEEYNKRKKEQIKFIKNFKSINKLSFEDADYENELYKDKIKGYENYPEGSIRCTNCFELRLDKTAKHAKDNKFDYFGTTLTVSPHKNSEIINSLSEKIAKKYNIAYIYGNFKKENGYKKSIELSKKYELYRQDYCGCIYSKKEKETNF